MMKKLGITLVMPALLLVLGCSSSSKKQEPAASSVDIMDVLTDFSIAINEDNFEKAAAYMVAGESERLRGPDGKITDENKKKMKALKLHKLIKNPNIKLSRGKLTGIYNSLPMLKQGKVEDPVNPTEGSEESDSPAPVVEDEGMGPESQAPSMEGENADASADSDPGGSDVMDISATPDEFPDPEE